MLTLTLIAPMLWAAPAEAAPTVAILDLANNTGDPAFNGAGPGVAGLLISRFQQTAALDVVERVALEAVLTEHKLSRSALADPATAARTGRLVGARYVVTGQIFTLKLPTLSVTLRVIDTQRGEVVASRDVVGRVGDDGEAFFTLVDQLADEILAALDVHLSEAELQAMSKAELREMAAPRRHRDERRVQPALGRRPQAPPPQQPRRARELRGRAHHRAHRRSSPRRHRLGGARAHRRLAPHRERADGPSIAWADERVVRALQRAFDEGLIPPQVYADCAVRLWATAPTVRPVLAAGLLDQLTRVVSAKRPDEALDALDALTRVLELRTAETPLPRPRIERLIQKLASSQARTTSELAHQQLASLRASLEVEVGFYDGAPVDAARGASTDDVQLLNAWGRRLPDLALRAAAAERRLALGIARSPFAWARAGHRAKTTPC